MEAIKKILNPGKAKEDEIMYGETGSSVPVEKDAGAGQYNAGVPSGSNAPELHTLPDERKQSQGVLRQILNPGGEKHDDIAYGQTATTDAGATRAVDNSSSEKQPKEHGILRQIFNPGNDKYDPDNFKGSDDALAAPVREGEPIPGALATGSGAQKVHSTEAADDKSGVLRQILNPGGQKYDEMRYEPTANVASGMPQSRVPLQSDNASVLSIKSGVQGPYAADSATGTTSTNTTTHESHVGRNAALGAGAGAVAYEATKQHHLTGDYDKNTQTGLLGQTSGTSSGLSSTTGANTSATPQQSAYSSSTAPSQSAYTGATSTAPSQSGLTSTTGVPSSSHRGEEAALGAGALTAGGIAASQHHNTTSGQDTGLSHHVYNGVADPPPTKSGHAHDFTAPRTHIVGVSEGVPPAEPIHHPHGPSYDIPSAEEEPGTSAKVYNTVTGKHSGHEYDTPEHAGTSSGAERAATGTALVGATSSLPQYSSATSTAPRSSSTGPTSSSTSTSAPYSATPATSTQHSNIGTTGGTAAAALAAQEAARRHQTQQAGFAAATQTSTQPEHHYGRDATLAGGAGAAGVGAYEASKHGDSTGPASKTIGPHSSNVANILDPRVKPQPELMKSSTTSGPHQSDLANKLDPRVDTKQQSSHTGRDAALGAGAGAGVYEAEKHHESHSVHDAYTQPKEGVSWQPAQGTTTQSSTGHAERDAALGVGAGAATGAGIYEAEKYHGSQTSTQPTYGTSSQSAQGTTQPTSTHTGRDAALGVGAGAATGAGVYEAEKHHSSQQQPSHSTSTQTTTTTTTSTTGPHKSSLLNKLDPRVKDEDKQSHTGRDAALVGGAGAAVGAGAYEAEKHHEQTSSGLTSKTAGTDLRNEYNAGQTTGTSQIEPSHYGSGTAAGTTTGATGESGIERVIHEGHDVDEKHRQSLDGSRSRGPLVREDEHGHNKLHKEKKEGFLHKLLHPHKNEHEHESSTAGASSTTSTTGQSSTFGTTSSGVTGQTSATEPHTGLPLNQKYGAGVGGTDGAEPIGGYQSGSTTKTADYDDIAKKNTLY